MPNRPASPTLVRRLSKVEVPDGSLMLVWGDSHYGEHDGPANDLMVECADREGATHLIGNGDVFNCATVSHHTETRARALAKYGSLAAEGATGAKYLTYLAGSGRRAILGVGNHEDWINDVALYSGLGSTLSVRTALSIPDNIEVLPHGYQLRLGSLAIEHGDIVLGRGSGGANLAGNILRRYPMQTTVVNHFHREGYAVSTTPDSSGILRSHAAYALGHMSDPSAHYGYAGRTPDWQQGFGMIRVWYEDNKPRFTVTPVQIHRTRRGHPVFEYNGHVYR
jgi:hypothetical protein